MTPRLNFISFGEGGILAPTGKGGFVDISQVTLKELLERYDRAADMGLVDDPRQSVIDAYCRASDSRP